MKKIAFCLIASCLLLTFQPFQSNAATPAASFSVVVSKPAESPEAKALLLRLDKINAMDKSNLNSTEKKNLRKEVRSIRQQLKELDGGVYLSVGALLLIVIILIILL